MSEIMFCTIQDINDLLGTLSGVEFIKEGGTFEPTMVERRIITKSNIVNTEHTMNFNKTLVTDEYIDIVGIPRLKTKYRPIISVVSLAVWDGTQYDELTEGYNRNTDDFYIDKPEIGLIGFWSPQDSGKNYCKTSYYYGYEEIPFYVSECVAKMVAIDLALSKEFQEECKEQVKKWQGIISQWLEDVENLLKKHIRKKKLSVKTVGKYDAPNIVSELEAMTGSG